MTEDEFATLAQLAAPANAYANSLGYELHLDVVPNAERSKGAAREMQELIDSYWNARPYRRRPKRYQ